MNKIITAIIVFMGTLPAFAQQDPMFSQYMFNTLSINPGYAGSNDLLTAALIHRAQWTGIQGAPRTQTFTIHSPTPIDKTGVGFSIINDKTGPISYLGITADLAYHLPISDKGTLSVGMKAGITSLNGNLNSLETTEIGDGSLPNISSGISPNIGAGVYYHTPKYYIGISAPKVLESKFEGSQMSTSINFKRHYFFIAGTVFDVSPLLKLKPSVLSRIVHGAPISVDLNVNLIYIDKIWFGAFGRIHEGVGAIFQYQLNDQFRIGYSYDYALTDIQSYSSGSHEFMLRYDFSFNKGKVVSPRYF